MSFWLDFTLHVLRPFIFPQNLLGSASERIVSGGAVLWRWDQTYSGRVSTARDLPTSPGARQRLSRDHVFEETNGDEKRTFLFKKYLTCCCVL